MIKTNWQEGQGNLLLPCPKCKTRVPNPQGWDVIGYETVCPNCQIKVHYYNRECKVDIDDFGNKKFLTNIFIELVHE